MVDLPVVVRLAAAVKFRIILMAPVAQIVPVGIVKLVCISSVADGSAKSRAVDLLSDEKCIR